MEGQLIYKYEFVEKLDKLVHQLFEKEYFGFIDSSEDYIQKIFFFIIENIHLSHHKPTPRELEYLGDYYIFYKPNKQTTWYILFDKRDADILITNIFNNHCEDANFL